MSKVDTITDDELDALYRKIEELQKELARLKQQREWESLDYRPNHNI